jgi:hypothetical protein
MERGIQGEARVASAGTRDRTHRRVGGGPTSTNLAKFCAKKVRLKWKRCKANDRNATLAIGSVRTQDQAERLIEILKRAGFSDQDVSVILPDDKLIQDPKIALDHKPGDDPADENRATVPTS